MIALTLLGIELSIFRTIDPRSPDLRDTCNICFRTGDRSYLPSAHNKDYFYLNCFSISVFPSWFMLETMAQSTCIQLCWEYILMLPSCVRRHSDKISPDPFITGCSCKGSPKTLPQLRWRIFEPQVPKKPRFSDLNYPYCQSVFLIYIYLIYINQISQSSYECEFLSYRKYPSVMLHIPLGY